MNCYYHADRQAVAQCIDCGKGLCSECASHYDKPICMDCVMNRNQELKSSAFKSLASLIIGIVLGIVFYIINKSGSDGPTEFTLFTAIIFGIEIAGIPVGWKALNKITPNMFIWLPLAGWVIYYVVKFVLALLIGIIAVPVKTIKGFVQYSKAVKNDAYAMKSFK